MYVYIIYTTYVLQSFYITVTLRNDIDHYLLKIKFYFYNQLEFILYSRNPIIRTHIYYH